MSVNRLLLNLWTTDSLMLKINLVSIGVLMIMVGHLNGALGSIEPDPHYKDPIMIQMKYSDDIGTTMSTFENSMEPKTLGVVGQVVIGDDKSSLVSGGGGGGGGGVGGETGVDGVIGANENKKEIVGDGGIAPHNPDITNDKEEATFVNDLGFIHAFVASLSVILVSELGDKTFFIAAIMAMRHARLIIFAGAIGALGLMTILSGVFGMAATIIPRVYTYYISTALFAIFGLKMLKDGYYMSPNDAQEEFEEVQSDLKKREEELLKKSSPDGSSKSPNTVIVESLDEDNRKMTSVKDLRRAIDQNGGPNSDILANGISSHHQSTASLTTGGGGTTGTTSGQLQRRIGGSVDHLHASQHSLTKNNSLSKISEINTIELKPLNNNNNNSTYDQEAAQSLMKSNTDIERGSRLSIRSTGSNKSRSKVANGGYVNSRVFMQAFTMTFLAEWGDRSQLTTIILSARENILGVIVGGILGHSFCTGLAVIGGRMIAQRISVRTVTIIGGVVFLLFALSALIFGPGDEEPVAVKP